MQFEPLPGEDPDKLIITDEGTRFRVRIVQVDRTITRATGHLTTEDVVPSSVCLSISLSALDINDEVRQIDGKYLIFDRHELTIEQTLFADPNFDIAATLLEIVEERAIEAEAIIAGMAATVDYLATEWGINFVGDAPTL
jgi:hypothetical protein